MIRIALSAIAASVMSASPLVSTDAQAAGVNHHGGPLLHCTPPMFFDESPGKDASVAEFSRFSVMASDNTDPATIKVWINNQPVKARVTPQRSGRLAIEGETPTPITSGKVWIKVTGFSVEECDELYNWHFSVGR